VIRRLGVVGGLGSSESELESSSASDASDADPPEEEREERDVSVSAFSVSVIRPNAPRGKKNSARRVSRVSDRVSDVAVRPETRSEHIGRDATFAWSPARYTELTSGAARVAAAPNGALGSTTSPRLRRAVAKTVSTESVAGDATPKTLRGRSTTCSRRQHPPFASASVASNRGARVPQQGHTPTAFNPRVRDDPSSSSFVVVAVSWKSFSSPSSRS
jgi:hypothetical protein